MIVKEPLPIVVLISGNGSNLQAIIKAAEQGLAVDIRAVISNRSDAFGLERARKANIPTHVIPHLQFSNRQVFEDALLQQIDYYQPQLVVLAGFMRRLTADFVKHYRARMINIHPSLLPKYPGLDTHQRALAAKDAQHGVTIHYVNEQVDGGPIICQASLDILTDDTQDSLLPRIHQLEHRLYPLVLEWIAAGRLSLTPLGVMFDGKLINKSGLQLSPQI